MSLYLYILKEILNLLTYIARSYLRYIIANKTKRKL
jgi:hypothetical protein